MRRLDNTLIGEEKNIFSRRDGGGGTGYLTIT